MNDYSQFEADSDGSREGGYGYYGGNRAGLGVELISLVALASSKETLLTAS